MKTLRWNPRQEWMKTKGNHLFIGLTQLVNWLYKNPHFPPESIGLEIGCYMGESSSILLASGMFSHLDIIDPMSELEHIKTSQNSILGVPNWEYVEKEFKMNLRHFNNYTLYRTTDRELLPNLPNMHYDFIYIDGDHGYDSVKFDIEVGMDKLKVGGFIAGHDWDFISIRNAVEDTIGEPDEIFDDHSWIKRI
jgi:hypothetical protein